MSAIAQVDARFADAVFESHDLTAIAPRMPMSTAEILDGARRRAEALLALPSQSGSSSRFAIGVEGGVDRLPSPADGWTLQTWAAVSDGSCWGYGAGPSIALPPTVSARVASGDELGDVIDEVAGVHGPRHPRRVGRPHARPDRPPRRLPRGSDRRLCKVLQPFLVEIAAAPHPRHPPHPPHLCTAPHTDEPDAPIAS